MNAPLNIDPLSASAVTMINAGGYVLSWKVESKLFDGKVVATPSNNNICVTQKDTIVLSSFPGLFAEGVSVWPRIHPVAGEKHSADHHVVYKPNGVVALYEASGTTLDPHLAFKGFLIPPPPAAK
ncbi:MAG: hypothetical protein JNK85_10105 [Verrucomicrobiales bacterium]|nr:hypothetical protein [Verrucomicrobiales bacterium]